MAEAEVRKVLDDPDARADEACADERMAAEPVANGVPFFVRAGGEGPARAPADLARAAP